MLAVTPSRSLKAKRIMHYAAEQAGMKLASRHSTADAPRGRDQGSAADAGGGGASAVVLIHEQEAAALTACRDPCKDVPTLKVRLRPVQRPASLFAVDERDAWPVFEGSGCPNPSTNHWIGFCVCS